MTAPSCPTAQQLQEFLLGKADDAAAAEMGRHLAECSRCVQLLESIGDEAGMAEAVTRSQSSPAPPRTDQSPPQRASEAMTEGANSDDAALHQTADSELFALLAPPQAPDEIGRLGSYRVLKVLGAGGMGVVFQAEDPALHRLVALKTLKPGIGATDVNRQRFLREAQATAAIEHDHIVPIYAVGEVQGMPYLAMQFLKGETLEEHLKAHGRLPLADILRIGGEIAEGLAAAHEHGLIHRDIKPSNVWLEAGSGRVKIVDFGLAREASDNTHLTQSGFVVGTPGYMPPEQARGKPVDARGDLFSLGCILYLMATGAPPFQGTETLGILVAVATDTPKSPRELNPGLPPALDELIMRSLAKEANQRPASASEVIDTLRAIAVGRPVPVPVPDIALATTLLAESPRPAKSRRLLLALFLVMLAGLGVGGYLAAPALLRPTANLGRLVIDTNDANLEVIIEQGDVAVETQTAQREFDLPPGDYVVTVMDVQEEQARVSKTITVVRGETVTADVPGWLGEVLDPPPPIGLTPLPPDRGTVLVEGGADRADIVIKRGAEVVISRTKRRQFTLPVGTYDIELVGRMPNMELAPSHFTVTAGAETSIALRLKAGDGGPLSGTLSLVTHPAVIPGIRSWTIETRSHRGPVRTAAYSPDGAWLATGGTDGTIRIWEPGTGKLKHALIGHGQAVMALSWAANSSTLASLGHDWTTIRYWEIGLSTAGRRAIYHLPSAVNAIALAPNGKLLATAGVDGAVQLWETSGPRKEAARLADHNGEVRAVAWSPDGKVLASAGNDRVIRLWPNPMDKPKPRRLAEHKDAILALAWSPDGKVLASAGKDHKLLLWDAERDKVVRSFAWEPTSAKVKNPPPAGSAALSWSKTKTLASINSEGVQLWKLDSDKAIRSLAFPGRAVSWSADSKTLALVGYDDESVRYGDAATGQVRVALPGIRVERPVGMAFSPDGARLAVQGDRVVWTWSVANGKLLRTLEGHGNHSVAGMAWSPDGKRLATSGGLDRAVQLWDATTGKPQQTLKVTQQHVGLVSWSPDGRIVAAAAKSFNDPASMLYLWDADSGKVVHQLTGYQGGVTGLAWSRDGRVLIVSGADTMVRFWSVRSGKLLRWIRPYNNAVWAMALSPDGKVLATAGDSSDHMLRLWDARTGSHLRDLPGQTDRVLGLGWLSDSKTLVQYSNDHFLRFLDAQTGAIQRALRSPAAGAQFLPDHGFTGNVSLAYGLRLRDVETNRPQLTLLVSHQGNADAYLTVTADGHHTASARLESELVYVFHGERGLEMLPPDKFTKFKNDPKQVRLVPAVTKDDK